MSETLSREDFEECVMRSDDGGANAVLDHDAEQRARIAELTDALTAEQERHANMTRLFDDSDNAVKEKDARMAELEAGLREDRFNLDSWKTVVDNCLAEMQLIRKERDAAMAAMEDATRQNALQVDRLVAEARELRKKMEAEAKRLDFALQARAIVIDGTVYTGCDWKSGIECPGGSVVQSKTIAETRRQAIDAAMSAADQEQG